MHRTQVMLEESQYVALRERARRSGKSMGELIRELLGRELSSRVEETVREPEGLYALQGSLCDERAAATDHDDILYGNRE